ncbi:D-inositol-3-phosphate glycosyltransferase [Neomoorella glycerini]|uniref:D-inositol-3-phosphate glycosyltransferase n=1 Tax=Neomoorella glycerini TaxID=55779 RepID=A0A6I5ZW44_9FIRM|nr:1,4-alpha-glucan branching protein domain-containing protein [Moorella glycerini]QGP93899.1 D-inositol-3-phosphate glycosyltransferase [Moorella glycerini]
MAALADNHTGYLALLLHAHLPFVRNQEDYISLEEKWLCEALTESYFPLILSWERLAREGINFKLTLSLSPPLISMLIDPRLPERYGRYLDNLKRLAAREVERTQNDPVFSPVADFYHRRLADIEGAFNEAYRGDLLSPLKRLQEQGHLEIITTCATHGYLPLMLTRESWRVQVRAALDLFADIFGRLPAGMWLPECGYTPGIEKCLQAEGIKYFIVASHGLLNAVPRVKTAVYAPVKLPGGVAVFGRDWETSHQVWSRTEGYPGDPLYREFYRDIGYDLEFSYLEPYLIGGIRGDTGFKYYRITGKTEYKEPYDFQAARERAREHARDFLAARDRQLSYWAGIIPDKPVIVAPYDAELFGHWWFEGPVWLEEVLRLAAGQDYQTGLTTLAAYLEQYPPRQEVALGLSSWGEGGYNRVWLNPANDWLYPHLHRAEKTMVNLAATCFQPTPLQERALNQAARELLLAQSSDWPFILTSQTTAAYAHRRLEEHLGNFFKICRDYQKGDLQEDFIRILEVKDNLFPRLDFRLYRPERQRQALNWPGGEGPVLLMLSWEFPPHHVGGLGIHVRDLAAALAQMGVRVHVITRVPGREAFTTVQEGVAIHHLPTYQQPGVEIDFLSWVLQFNMALADYGRELRAALPGTPMLLHAHDWLVAWAAGELQEACGVPLVATIHATEYGRNKGLHNRIQRTIHQIEAGLVARADRVICCSRYMEEEIRELFQPRAAVKVIPNGVVPIKVAANPGSGHDILFIGRLVVEKGVQVLLEALARLRGFYPQARLIIAGAGPYAGELQALAARLGVAGQVEFTGFVSEAERNQLLARTRVAVFPSLYEPFGIVALEAMSAGVPVIVARTGGLAEVVEDGVTGLVFNPGDVEDLLRCLVTIFQNPELAAELSRQARARVERDYTWTAVARQTLSLYQELLREPSPEGDRHFPK